MFHVTQWGGGGGGRRNDTKFHTGGGGAGLKSAEKVSCIIWMAPKDLIAICYLNYSKDELSKFIIGNVTRT